MVSNISNSEAVAVIALSETSSALSVFGSVSIMYLIAKKQKWRHSIFHRIMMGLSLADAVWSVANMMHAFMLPPGTTARFNELGNATTCNIAGFLTNLVVTSCLYSFVLSAYFFLTITRGWSENQMKRLMEPWVHILSWGLAVAVAAPVLFVGGYEPSAFGVCLANRSSDAGSVEKTATAFTTLLMLVPATVGFVLIWLMYGSVRKLRVRNQCHDFPSSNNEQQQKTKAIATQGLFYSLAFLNTFLGAILSYALQIAIERRLLQGAEEGKVESSRALVEVTDFPKGLFYASFLLYIMLPLQGFLNWIVYVRPNVLRWKSSQADKSWWWAYRQVLSGRPTPRLNQRASSELRQSAAMEKRESPLVEVSRGTEELKVAGDDPC